MIFRYPAITRNLAYIFQLPGYMGLLTSLAAVVYGEYISLVPFLGIATLTLLPSWIILKKTPTIEGKGKIASPAIFAAFSYGIVSIIGALPLYFTALLFDINGVASSELINLYSPLNALFESFAGFTSSGLTMLNNPELVPHVIQLWRSLSQWFGGLGVIILAIFIFTPGIGGTGSLIETEVGNLDMPKTYIRPPGISV